jgi:hypothetical protein
LRVIVTGCRHWEPEQLAERVIKGLVARHGAARLVIVHGACPTGIDALFARVAAEHLVAVHPFPADWRTHGKKAGPIRNQAMVDAGAALCLAFHRDLPNSKGTGDCVRRALAAGIPTWLVGGEDFPPVRQRLAGAENHEGAK